MINYKENQLKLEAETYVQHEAYLHNQIISFNLVSCTLHLSLYLLHIEYFTIYDQRSQEMSILRKLLIKTLKNNTDFRENETNKANKTRLIIHLLFSLMLALF